MLGSELFISNFDGVEFSLSEEENRAFNQNLLMNNHAKEGNYRSKIWVWMSEQIPDSIALILFRQFEVELVNHADCKKENMEFPNHIEAIIFMKTVKQRRV